MKRIIHAFIFVFTVGIMGLHAQTHNPGDYVPNEVMVMLKPGYSADALVKELNSQGLVGQFWVKEEVSKRYRVFLIAHDGILGESKKLVYDINNMDGVALAQCNYYVQSRVTPNDANFATQQWSMNNTGQAGGTVDADVDAPEAWNTTTGGVTADGDTIVVAVVDGGFQLNHPDLTANIFRNYNEIPANGIDDDGNGYVDDRNGWNAYNNNGTISGDAHGTHCAGIVGARGNNSAGVAGVNWNVKIMTVAGSSGTQSTVVNAYTYIATMREIYNTTNGAQGAFVVATSNSFGVDFGQAASFPIWCAFYDSLGVLGILSAGAGPNANTNIDTQGDIPTTCPSSYMIAVTNTTRNDAKNNSAGFGPINMDIGAPGTDIYSTVTGSSYQAMTGTSMATPHVAGAIGLYYAAACLEFIEDYKANPGALALQMRTYLLTGVDSISALATNTSSRGRLNLNKGIMRVQTYNCAGAPPPTAAFSANDQTVCAGTVVNYTDNSTNTPTAWNWSFPGGTPSSSTSQNPTITYNSAGTYNAQLIVSNADGSDTILLTNYIVVSANPTIPVITDNSGTLQSSQTGAGNQWLHNGNPVGGATNDTYTPTQGGVYTVVYTDVNGCSATSAGFVTSVGIEDPVVSFSIYPNPVSEKLIIDAGAVIKANIQIMDLSGRVVVNARMNQSMQQIDVSGLANGIYMVKLEYYGKSITQKIIKR